MYLNTIIIFVWCPRILCTKFNQMYKHIELHKGMSESVWFKSYVYLVVCALPYIRSTLWSCTNLFYLFSHSRIDKRFKSPRSTHFLLVIRDSNISHSATTTEKPVRFSAVSVFPEPVNNISTTGITTYYFSIMGMRRNIWYKRNKHKISNIFLFTNSLKD